MQILLINYCLESPTLLFYFSSPIFFSMLSLSGVPNDRAQPNEYFVGIIDSLLSIFTNYSIPYEFQVHTEGRNGSIITPPLDLGNV